MKYLALALLVASTALAQQVPQHRRFEQPSLRVSSVVAAGATCSQKISCAVTAGDEAGNWWLLDTDGTMAASSHLTLVKNGTPSLSPMVFDSSSKFFSTAGNTTVPTGDFSFVASLNITSVSAVAHVVGKWGSGTIQWIAFVTAAGLLELIVSAADTSLTLVPTVATPPTATWLYFGGTYTSATGVVKLRYNSVNATGTGTGGVAAQNFKTSVALEGDGTQPLPGQSRGVFFTEKVLSDADIDRIGAGSL